MFKLLKLLVWIGVFVGSALAVDQLLLKRPLNAPGVKQFQVFYVDFRTRLFTLFNQQSASVTSVEELIQQSPAKQEQSAVSKQRHLYVDEQGVIHFADSLAEVPPAYRQAAQPLEE